MSKPQEFVQSIKVDGKDYKILERIEYSDLRQLTDNSQYYEAIFVKAGIIYCLGNIE